MFIKPHHLMLVGCWLSPFATADTPLGEINIQLRATVVDFTCYVETADSDKTVQLGRWPTKQLQNAGNTTPPVRFSLRLAGCPPGSASITFSGRAASNPALLALKDSVMAQKVAVELRDRDRTPLALETASQEIAVDSNGNATLQFYANYIALADNPAPGTANADATFAINYY
ncbi:fimbria assembly protein [Kosakonia sp. R1.Fl]|uniref:fimbria assembly protein n=1 Tax=Kosakonia sp. R1.Fl TaxID=2928706 RepID=UPI00201E4B6D|nr:fimbria assembly protein [Kosakonia sp. R1.Fl]MCL6746810.1 fimbria assembly protein [Kosakonia sp. R1.Fl]